MPDIRPGTRCECGPQGHLHGCDIELHGGLRCDNTAVRMVTVRVRMREITPNDVDTQVPMCEPCAKHHESKEASSA